MKNWIIAGLVLAIIGMVVMHHAKKKCTCNDAAAGDGVTKEPGFTVN